MKAHFSTVDNLASLKGGGKAGELIRRTNWSETPMGKPGELPSELFTCLGILLNSPIPMVLLWGKDMVFFCNDSYISIPGSGKSRPVIGEKAMNVLSEIWVTLSTSIEKVMKTRASVLQEERRFSLSPIFGQEGNITGVFVYL
ncbi:hypothetical protein [Flavihumibacter solisilvae]|uniref:PAS domain-containing protein n=1 Tax=Flavihumibacter solisilvae TaxID=1349421 RepID=A0A0C1IIE1_9BACT|nr:hypothetical protein [Flavihumibacter solisilvae]KIC93960.1 hypothetical protein OI18_13000 [Flavihumibacter solisilvae]